jgi:hypothetical protein
MPIAGQTEDPGRSGTAGKPESERSENGGTTGAIFINYRRVDSDMSAGRLADILKRSFGSGQIFMDIDGIDPGVDFVEVISQHLSLCQVFIAVIGPNWLRVRSGLSRRIFFPNDFVRLEIVAALSRDILVIPVLVAGATMPSARSLPNSIAEMTGRNAVSVSTERFSQDVDALVTIIKRRLNAQSPPQEREAERARISALLKSDIGRTEKSFRGRRAVMGSMAAAIVSLSAVLVKKSFDNPFRNRPQFGQIEPDATKFAIAHESESAFYEALSTDDVKLSPLKFPPPRGASSEPILSLQQVLDIAAGEPRPIADHTVFHAVGCTGSTVGPTRMAIVADTMTQELSNSPQTDKPAFLFHLGDVIYGFG